MQHQLINTIRHSLNAAQSALSLMEELNRGLTKHCTGGVETVVETVAEPVAVVETVAEPVAVVETVAEPTVETVAEPAVESSIPTLIQQVLSKLNDPRYKMRTLSELSSWLGITQGGIFKVLDDNGIRYVIKTRNSDGAKLIGLSSRN